MYTLRDVSFYTGYRVRTIRGWIMTGKLKAKKSDTGYRWIVSQDELDRALEDLKHADKD